MNALLSCSRQGRFTTTCTGYRRGIALRGCFVLAQRPPPRRHLVALNSAKTNSTQPSLYAPKNARDAIETGTKAFKEDKNVEEALRLYKLAMDMQPNEDEARAALYNMGCGYAKQKKWADATSCITRAINDYKLKLVVALKDDDLAELRDTREWIEALTTVKGGLSRNAKLDLRTEAKAPFRFPRIILVGALLAGASLGLFIIILRLISAFRGGPDAPDLTETLQNLGINTTAVGVLGFILYRDLQSKQKDLKVTDREERLSRLQVDLGNNRALPLIKFRGTVRPVILAGTRAFIDKALKEAEPYYLALRNRGVSVVPIVYEGRPGAQAAGSKKGPKELDPSERILALKREFNAKAGDSSKGFDPSAKKDAVRTRDDSGEATEEDRKWRLTAYDADEWAQWVVEQKEFANLSTDKLNCYIQVQLDGTVRGSGTGIPPWSKFVDDLPELSDIRTTFTDGIGPSI